MLYISGKNKDRIIKQVKDYNPKTHKYDISQDEIIELTESEKLNNQFSNQKLKENRLNKIRIKELETTMDYARRKKDQVDMGYKTIENREFYINQYDKAYKEYCELKGIKSLEK